MLTLVSTLLAIGGSLPRHTAAGADQVDRPRSDTSVGLPRRANASLPSPVLVTVVIKDRFGRAGLAAIVRRNPGGETIVALKRSAATPELIGAALASFARSYRKYGAALTMRISVYIREGTTLPKLTAADAAVYAAMIARLQRTVPHVVPGVGKVSAVTIQVDPSTSQLVPSG